MRYNVSTSKEHDMAELQRVGTRELKNKLSEYMRRVKAGETIIVTERGKAVGQIIPVKPTLEERLQAMVDAGLAEWNGQKLKPHKPAAINRGKKLVSDLVVEDRNVDYLP
jgi:prevent-host-death family protein